MRERETQWKHEPSPVFSKHAEWAESGPDQSLSGIIALSEFLGKKIARPVPVSIKGRVQLGTRELLTQPKSLEIKYQTRNTVFDHISKHREEG